MLVSLCKTGVVVYCLVFQTYTYSNDSRESTWLSDRCGELGYIETTYLLYVRLLSSCAGHTLLDVVLYVIKRSRFCCMCYMRACLSGQKIIVN
jgi:hypothetical protein